MLPRPFFAPWRTFSLLATFASFALAADMSIPAAIAQTPAESPTPAAAAPAEKDPRADVQATIRLIVAALEDPKPDYVKFIRDFADPNAVAQLEEAGKLDTVGKMFGEKRAAIILSHMKSIVDKAPTQLTEEVATFTVVPAKESELAARDKVNFRRINNRWYIVN